LCETFCILFTFIEIIPLLEAKQIENNCSNWQSITKEDYNEDITEKNIYYIGVVSLCLAHFIFVQALSL